MDWKNACIHVIGLRCFPFLQSFSLLKMYCVRLSKRYETTLQKKFSFTYTKQKFTDMTQNMRGIKRKEEELIEEVEKAKLDILAVTDTKKKGQQMLEMEGGRTLPYTGVKLVRRVSYRMHV